MNQLAIVLGAILLILALGAAPMPLTVSLQNPSRNVVIYPNLLLSVPLILLAVLLLLYGVTWKRHDETAHSGTTLTS